MIRNETLPKFTFPTGPIDPLDPWKGIDADDSEFVQLDIVRDGKDVACVVEVDYIRASDPAQDEVVIGNCFDVRGNFIKLTDAEQDRAREDWTVIQERKAERESR